MRTQTVDSRNNNTNLAVAGIAGGLATAGVSRMVPLTHAEHTRAFSPEVLNKIKESVAQVRADQFTRVANEAPASSKNIVDTFVASKDVILEGAKDKIDDVAKTLDGNNKTVFNQMVQSVNQVGEYANSILTKNVIKDAKKSRPVAYFAAFGAMATMTAAVLKNVVSTKKAQQDAIAISYDKKGSMVIDAPDNLALAIVLDETV